MSELLFLDVDEPPETPLYARTFRQMWQEAWGVFRGEWPRWFGLTLIGYAPNLLMGLLLPARLDLTQVGREVVASGSLERAVVSGDWLVWTLASIGVAVLGWAYTVLVLHGAGAVMASQMLAHQPPSLRQALRTMLTRRGAALLAGNLLFAVTVLAIGLLSTVTAMCLVGLLGFAFLVYMVLVWPPIFVPLLVLERGPLIRLMSRAWYFGRQRVWVIVAVIVSLSILSFLTNLPLTWLQNYALPDMVSVGADGVRTLTPAYWEWRAVFILLGLIVQGVVLPLGAILRTILYYDARARLDPPDAIYAVEAGDPPAPPLPWLTAIDLGNTLFLGIFGGLVFGLLAWISTFLLRP